MLANWRVFRLLVAPVLSVALAGLAAAPLLACAQPLPAQVSASVSPSPSANAAPVVHALLIGITDYDARNGTAPLNGPANDVKLMHDVLTTRFKVPPGQIRLLLNPTHSTIEQEFAALQQRVGHDDFVYVHYSGHGSTAPDPGDPRGEDQTWVARGARASSGAAKDRLDVLDKEIAVWMAPLYERTQDVVFVSDSCHSGTVGRGSSRGVRSAEPVPAPHPLLASLPKVAAPAGGVRIGAARDFEPAVELDHRNGRGCNGSAECYGVFTWNWAQALRESRPGEAWGDVFDRASARITTQPGIYQRPQIEGRADRAVFAGRYTRLSPTLGVIDVVGGTATLDSGVLGGVTIGSVYTSVAAPGTTPATLTVSEVNALTSRATITGGSVKRTNQVIEVTHAYDAPAIRLYLGKAALPADDALIGKVRKLLTGELGARLSAFSLAPTAADADLLLQPARLPANAPSPPPGATRKLPDDKPCAAPCAPPQLWVVTRAGLLVDEHLRFDLARVDEEDERLVSDLNKYAHAQQVRRLAAQGNAAPLQLSVTVWRPPAGDKRPCVAGTAPASGWSRLGPFPAAALGAQARLNDCLEFAIENGAADRTLYGYVVTVGPTLGVTMALPSNRSGSDEARIEPGKHISADHGHLYRLDTVGRETILLLASDGPVRAQALQQDGLRGEPKSRLEALLMVASTGRGTVEADGEWGAASIDLLVGPPGP